MEDSHGFISKNLLYALEGTESRRERALKAFHKHESSRQHSVSRVEFPNRLAHGTEVGVNSFSAVVVLVILRAHTDEQTIATPVENVASFQRPTFKQRSMTDWC